MTTPYVVSGDIYILLKQWALRNGFILPDKNFFAQMRANFSEFFKLIFSGFIFISEEEISQGIQKLLASTGVLPVSLDVVYSNGHPRIELTRLVDEKGEDRGLGRRPGSKGLLQQMRGIKDTGVECVALVDDVLFTGDLMERTVNLFAKFNIRVPFIVAGIGIADGIGRLRNLGCEVRCVQSFSQVIDEVCERDFFPGVPLSGRTLVSQDNVGLPYILPFGKPGKWASIPKDWENKFSQFCLEQTVGLFSSIERATERSIYYSDLERKVFGLPVSRGNRFVDLLRGIKIY